MNHGIVPYLAMAFAIPLLMLLVRFMKNALSDGVGKPWAWFAAAFVFVLAGEGTGLLHGIGIDPRRHEGSAALRAGTGVARGLY